MDLDGQEDAVPGKVDVVAMPPEVADADTFQVGAAVVAAMATGITAVVVDFTSTRSCDRSSISQLLIAERLAAANGISLRLAVPAALWLVFDLAGAGQVLAVYSTLREALMAEDG